MKERNQQMLEIAGAMCFLLAAFQAAIGFSPALSLYFGAPEALVQNKYALIGVSLLVSIILVIFGLYAWSGADRIPRLPWLKQALVSISGIFILRGLLGIFELFVVMGVVESAIPIAPRFVLFSLGSLLVGGVFISGTIGKWHRLGNKGA